MSDDPPPAPVSMGAEDARVTLLTIAALHGGTVQGIYDFSANELLGYAWMPDGEIRSRWSMAPTWIFDKFACEFAWRSPASLRPGRPVVPVGRIDCGLGAITPNGNRPGKP